MDFSKRFHPALMFLIRNSTRGAISSCSNVSFSLCCLITSMERRETPVPLLLLGLLNRHCYVPSVASFSVNLTALQIVSDDWLRRLLFFVVECMWDLLHKQIGTRNSLRGCIFAEHSELVLHLMHSSVRASEYIYIYIYGTQGHGLHGSSHMDL
jgi:hypothetical protein